MVHTPPLTTITRTLPQYVAALAAAGGAFAAGTLLGWTSPAQIGVLAGVYGFPVNSDEYSWVGSAMTLGAAFVCIPIGFLINFIGRKLTMLLLVLPFTLGWCLLIWADGLAMMYVSRFILGVSGGAFCVTAPLYTGEIAQKDIRGTLGSFFQLMISAGILFVYAIGDGLDVFWMSIVCALIPLLFGIVFIFMPESPTYWIYKDNEERAIQSLKWLRGKHYDYQPEIDELKSTEEKIRQKSTPLCTALLRPIALKAMAISLGLMMFQQLCGVNAVIFYSTTIFEDAHTGIDDRISTIIVAIVQIVATFISVLVVDRLGRRLLLLTSASIMALSTIAMGVYFYLQQEKAQSVSDLAWLPVCSLCVYIVVFSLGFGPIPWLMMGELFATDIKGIAGSIAGTLNWLCAFVVTKTFVNLKQAIGSGETFWLFAGICVLGVIFVFFCVPETKGKSLNEIQIILEGKENTTNWQDANVIVQEEITQEES